MYVLCARAPDVSQMCPSKLASAPSGVRLKLIVLTAAAAFLFVHAVV